MTTLDDAVAELGALCAAASDPIVPDGDLVIILLRNQLADTAGRLPSDAAWEPRYDMNRAAAAAWRVKAANAAGDFDFAELGSSFSRQQVVASCLAMAREYSRRITGQVPVVASGMPSWLYPVLP